MSKIRKTAAAALILLVIIFVSFYLLKHEPEASFAAPVANRSEKSNIDYVRKGLLECTPTNIKMTWFDKDGYEANLQIDTNSKVLECQGWVDDPNASSTPAWNATFPGYYPPHLSDIQLAQVEKLLNVLPPSAAEPSPQDNAAYKGQYHLAFYKGTQLQIRDYPKSDPPKEFLDLLKFLCVENYYR